MALEGSGCHHIYLVTLYNFVLLIVNIELVRISGALFGEVSFPTSLSKSLTVNCTVQY